MLRAVFNRQKNSRPFKEYHTEWFNTLKNNLLPLLRRSISGDSLPTLSTHVEILHQHFQSYYYALDAAATSDPSQLLHQDWRNSLEKPLLWLADLHPFLFTNLARSFLDDTDTDSDTEETNLTNPNKPNVQNDGFLSLNRPWQISMAWRNPSETLTSRMDQIERGLRAIVPTVTDRLARAESTFVDHVMGDWFRCKDNKSAARMALGSNVKGHMEEVVNVFLYANRLRRSVLVDIISAATVYQAALFLEGLAQFVIGLKDHELVNAVEHCKSLSLDARDGRESRSRCHY